MSGAAVIHFSNMRGHAETSAKPQGTPGFVWGCGEPAARQWDRQGLFCVAGHVALL